MPEDRIRFHMELGTFSITAKCRKTGDFGVASATAAPCVGAMLPYAAEGVGAVATQAWVNVNLGYYGIELMRQGLAVKSALESLLSEDPGKEKRQVIGVDSNGSYGFTGSECTAPKGQILKDDFAVAGNILAGERVLERMAKTFRESKGELSSRLLVALEEGQAAGGDRRGKLSAVLLVASKSPRIYNDIRVDYSSDPVVELRRIYNQCVHLQHEFTAEDEEGEVLRLRVSRVRD